MLLIGMFAAGQVKAQWAVIDGAAIASNQQGQALQLAKTVEEYTQLVTQYENMISSIGALKDLGLSSLNNPTMQLINDPTPYVQQACPSNTGIVGTIAGAVGLTPPSVGIDIKQAQNQICQQITVLQIDKYNKVAGLLNQMNSYAGTLQSINSKFDDTVGKVSSAMGNRDALNSQTNTSAAMFTAAYKNVEQQLAADDAAIATLKAQQSMLGDVALKGSPSLLGNAMQTVIFTTALSQ
jgi:hypothetical protein